MDNSRLASLGSGPAEKNKVAKHTREVDYELTTSARPLSNERRRRRFSIGEVCFMANFALATSKHLFTSTESAFRLIDEHGHRTCIIRSELSPSQLQLATWRTRCRRCREATNSRGACGDHVWWQHNHMWPRGPHNQLAFHMKTSSPCVLFVYATPCNIFVLIAHQAVSPSSCVSKYTLGFGRPSSKADTRDDMVSG